MRHATRKVSELAVGERVVFGPDIRTDALFGKPRELALWTLEAVDGHFADLVSAAGGTMRIHVASGQEFVGDDKLSDGGRSIAYRNDLGRLRGSLLWTDALPAGTDAQVLAYVDTILGVAKHSYDQGVVVHVTEVRDGTALGDVAFYASDTKGRDCEPFVGEIVGNAAFWATGIEFVALPGVEMSVGDLLVAREYRAEHANGRDLVTLGGATVLGNFPTRADVGRFLPMSARGESISSLGFVFGGNGPATDVDVSTEIARGVARSEPDEALIVTFRDVTDPKEVNIHCLGHTGYTFMMADSVDDYLYGTVLEPGLWVAEGAKWWSYTSYEGEHDSGIDMDFRPATLDDLDRFGYTEETLDAEIAEVSEVDPDPGMSVRAMTAAKAAAEADAVEEAERAVLLEPAPAP
jgi:hypothetical protein